MEGFASKFIEMFSYVPYIKDEKVRIQRFLSFLPPTYKDEIEIIHPNTLDGAIRKVE